MSLDQIHEWIQLVTGASQPFVQQNGPHSWLLKQSINTHFQRLGPLMTMPWFQHMAGSVLDIGAGTGALTLDLAWHLGTRGVVTAVDNDMEALKIAQSLAYQLGLTIVTRAGEATALPVEDTSQDICFARYLFQHLPDPAEALREMQRVTRPGGRIVVMDVDDEVTLCEVRRSEHVINLRNAIRDLQSQRGGNRLIGRQLYRLLREASLKSIQVLVIPRIRLGVHYGRNAELETYQIERLRRERDQILGSGLMTAEDFEKAIAETERGFSMDIFEMEADFLATGVVPTK